MFMFRALQNRMQDSFETANLIKAIFYLTSSWILIKTGT